jgi:hypothetical protein
MKTPLLIFVLSTAASLQWEPAAPEPCTTQCASRIERIRQELAGVELELMDVMRASRGAKSCLLAREASLKYALRAEQIRLAQSVPIQAPLPEIAVRCETSVETHRS